MQGGGGVDWPMRWDMEIPFATRSKFLEPCEASIRANRAQLGAGEEIAILLDDGGYPGQVIVTIRLTDRTSFETDWTGSDPTRFPMRIRSAATALLNCGCE